MSSLPTASPRAAQLRLYRLMAVACLALLVAACASGGGSSTPTQSQTVAGATATSTAAAPTVTLTAAPTTTAAVAATATLAPTATALSSQAPTPTPKPTPLPPLAVGLCKGTQLKLAFTSWQNSGSSYAHITATNKSASSCNMRGTGESQVLDGRGHVLVDEGSSAASVRSRSTPSPPARGSTPS